MGIEAVIENIRLRFEETFNELDAYFDKSFDPLNFQPKNGGWTASQILEHIYLTNHFLMIVADKMVEKSLKRVDAPIETENTNLERLEAIGKANTFEWIRPEHMEPQGEQTLAEVREKLQAQKLRCLNWLTIIPNGEGSRVQTTMTVNQLGKINTYEWIFFIVQHARRHIVQLEKNLAEWSQSTAR